jgi:hypothetical protein
MHTLNADSGTIQLTTDGQMTYIESSVITLDTLEYLFFTCLDIMPGAWVAMEMALSRYRKTQTEEQ